MLVFLPCIVCLTIVYQAIIKFAEEFYVGHRTGQNVPHIGLGVGLTFVLALQVIASLGIHHFFYRSTSTGVLLRGGLINAIYNRSLRLTSRARSTLTNGKLVNYISTDVSRIDFCAGFFHAVRIISDWITSYLSYFGRVGMDCPNSNDNLSYSPPSATRTFFLGWFRIFHPGDTGANLRHKTPFCPSEKKHGLDR